MASVSVPRIYGWGNPYARLPGAWGSSPSHGEGLQAPFLLGYGVGRAGPSFHECIDRA